MKNSIKKAVTFLSVAFISVGLILCVISANNGGSFLRAMEHSGMNIHFNVKGEPKNNYDPYTDDGSQYYYGNGGRSADDDMRDFFRQFGMSDDEIEMFIDPFGSGSDGNSRGNYPIQ